MNLFNPCYSWESFFPSSHFPYNLKRDITLITSLASLCCFSAQFKRCNSAKVQQSRAWTVSHLLIFTRLILQTQVFPELPNSVFLLFCLSIDPSIHPWCDINSFPFTFVSICLYCVWTVVKMFFSPSWHRSSLMNMNQPKFPLKAPAKFDPSMFLALYDTNMGEWGEWSKLICVAWLSFDLGWSLQMALRGERWKRRGNSVIIGI